MQSIYIQLNIYENELLILFSSSIGNLIQNKLVQIKSNEKIIEHFVAILPPLPKYNFTPSSKNSCHLVQGNSSS